MKNHEKGQVVVFAMLMMLVLVILGTSIVYLVIYESKSIIKSKAGVQSFYIASAGVHKALWEIGQDDTYTGEVNTTFSEGVFTITVSTTAVTNQYQIVATGYTPDAISPVRTTNIRVVCLSSSGVMSPTSALACNSSVTLKGNATIDGRPDVYGVSVPAGQTVTIQGASAVYGIPSEVGTADTIVFDDVFGMTQAQMQALATTTYVDPANNAAVTGITWVSFVSDSQFQITASGWTGDGILIVDGNLKITGGTFDGIIYVIGDLSITGNALIRGAIFVEGTAALTTGTPNINYNSVSIQDAADELGSSIQILSWEEF